jgi:hypothetical protein
MLLAEMNHGQNGRLVVNQFCCRALRAAHRAPAVVFGLDGAAARWSQPKLASLAVGHWN